MKVFLSGKVDEKFGSWRDAIIAPRHEWDRDQRKVIAIRQWMVTHRDTTGHTERDGLSVKPWPVLSGVIFGHHDYVGPFRQEFEDGCCGNGDSEHLGHFHGVTAWGGHGLMNDPERRAVLARCKEGIEAADVVFAYINSPDAYGTLFEIGYALALGKFVGLLIHPEALFEYDDLWLIEDAVPIAHSYPTRLPETVGWEWRPHVPIDETEAVVGALKDTIIAYAARPPRATPTPIATRRDVSDDAARSFQQIARWTSDPRVRDEATRMLKRLSS